MLVVLCGSEHWNVGLNNWDTEYKVCLRLHSFVYCMCMLVRLCLCTENTTDARRGLVCGCLFACLKLVCKGGGLIVSLGMCAHGLFADLVTLCWGGLVKREEGFIRLALAGCHSIETVVSYREDRESDTAGWMTRGRFTRIILQFHHHHNDFVSPR